MDPLLTGAIATLLVSIATWIHGRATGETRGLKVGASLRPPPPPRQCVHPDCRLPAFYCAKHGTTHHHHHESEPEQ